MAAEGEAGSEAVDRNRIYPPELTDEHKEKLAQLRAEIADAELEEGDAEFLSDHTLHRYLRARQYDLKKAKAMILSTLEWRHRMHPDDIRADEIEGEALTGKIRCQGKDRWGRPVLILDSTKENTKGHDQQMRHLVYNLERCVRNMKNGIEKLCIFIHLEDFSLRNSPPMKSSKETITTVLYHYPERLGHCIMYEAPWAFSGLWSVATPFFDEVTLAKIKFVRGNFDAGSPNDKLLTDIIGENWREVSGAGMPAEGPGMSPGYNHATVWAQVVADEKAWLRAKNGEPEPEPEAPPSYAAVMEAPAVAEKAPLESQAAPPSRTQSLEVSQPLVRESSAVGSSRDDGYGGSSGEGGGSRVSSAATPKAGDDEPRKRRRRKHGEKSGSASRTPKMPTREDPSRSPARRVDTPPQASSSGPATASPRVAAREERSPNPATGKAKGKEKSKGKGKEKKKHGGSSSSWDFTKSSSEPEFFSAASAF